MLPKGWQRSTLGECAELLTGYAFSSQDYAPENTSAVRLLRGDNVMQGTLRWEDAKYWALPYDKVLERYEMQLGDIVIAMDRPITNAGLKCSSVKETDLPCLLVQRVARMRAKENFEQEYLAQVLQTHSFMKHLKGQKTETAVPHISPNDLREFAISFPEKAEQRRIANVLSTWDQAIDATELLLHNTTRQKLGLMQKLLTGKVRLHGRTGVWRQYSLGSLFTERIENRRDDLPLLSITREDGVIPREDVGRKDTSNEDKSKYLRICNGDIGYNTMRMWQGVSALSSYEGIVSPAYTVVTPVDLIDAQFASYLFKSQALIFLFYRHSQGLVSDTWNLKYPYFAKIKVHIPGIHEQREISSVLEKVDQKLQVIGAQLKLLKDEKSALLVQLITGRRRMRVPMGLEQS